MENSITFVVAQIPPSYAQSLKVNFRNREMYLSQEARDFKTKVKLNVPKWKLDKDKNYIFSMHNKYNYNWYCKNGNVVKRDVQNMNRLLIDAVFDRLGRDDSTIFVVTDEKVQSEKEFTEVTLSVMGEFKKEG